MFKKLKKIKVKIINTQDNSDRVKVVDSSTYLHCAIGQLHYHGRLGPEPLVHIGYSGEGVTLFHCDRATCLHQVLIHVFQKEVHQFHFFLEIGWIFLDRVVQLVALAIDIVNVVTIRQHDQPRAVVVHHADAIVR